MECLRRLEDELMPLPGHLAPKHKQQQYPSSARHNATATAAGANTTTSGNVSHAGKGAAGRRHVRRRLFAPAPPPPFAAPGRDPEPFR